MDEIQKCKGSNFVTSFEGEQVDSKDHPYKSKFSIKKNNKKQKSPERGLAAADNKTLRTNISQMEWLVLLPAYRDQ